MACPYFLPETELETGPWLHAPRLPLGQAFSGVCRAGGEDHRPPPADLEALCNCGYARGVCSRFPAEAAADAVRFSVANENAGTIRVIYVLERDHAPEEFGSFEVSERSLTSAVLCAEGDGLKTILDAQARAFVRGYLASPTGQG